MQSSWIVHELFWSVVGVTTFFLFVLGGKTLAKDKRYVLAFEFSVFAYSGATELLVRIFRGGSFWPSYEKFFTAHPMFNPGLDRNQAATSYILITIAMLFYAVRLDSKNDRRASGASRDKRSRIICVLAMGLFLTTRACFDHHQEGIPLTATSSANSIDNISSTP